MGDQTILENMKRLKELCDWFNTRLSADYIEFVSLKGETTRQLEINKKLIEENRVLAEANKQAKETANAMIQIANEEAEKIKRFVFAELESARRKKEEAQVLLDRAKVELVMK